MCGFHPIDVTQVGKAKYTHIGQCLRKWVIDQLIPWPVQAPLK